MVASILRIGPGADVGTASAALLRDALLAHFEGSFSSEDSPPAVEKGIVPAGLAVSNRYFTANVLLADLLPSKNDDAGLAGAEDGIVLVFDSASDSSAENGGSVASRSFDALGSVHDAAADAGQCGELLRLCVGVNVGDGTAPLSSGGTKEREEEFSRRIIWCLDRGYEYVEADLSEEGRKRGHNERDKEGFARVAEAVAGTVWSSAVMKVKKATELRQSYERDTCEYQEKTGKGPLLASSSTAKTDDIKSEDAGCTEENANTGGIAASATCGYFVPAENENDHVDTCNSNGEQDKVVIEGRASYEMKASPFEIPEPKAGDELQDRQDVLFNELERAVGEASRIRDASKSGTLSDEERRQKAGDAALRLMDLMGKLDFGSDDEDEKDQGMSSDED